MRMTIRCGVALAAAAALAAGALAGCGQQAGDPAEQAPAIETYEVPPAQLQSVRKALQDVLSANDTGWVSSSDGRLVVMAPASTQESIARVIAELSQRPADAPPTNDAPLRLRFWMVAGGTGQGAADPRLEPLQPALAEASRSLGLDGFTLEGFVDVLASPGRRFSSQSSNMLVNGAAGLTDAGVGIDVDVVMGQEGNWDGGIDTDVILQPGQSVVLGTTDAPGGGMRLVIVQAEPAAGG